MTDEQLLQQHLEALRRWEHEGTCPVADPQAYVQEVFDHWAPMAEILDKRKLQGELLDLAVRLGYPDDYRQLKQLLRESEAKCEEVFRTFALPIRAVLDELGIQYTFKYRMKSVYSTWRKMRVDHKTFDDVYDLFAARIVYKPQVPTPTSANSVETLPEAVPAIRHTMKSVDSEHFTCWRIYAAISMLYRVHSGRIKNWISQPKPTGYQALHLTVMGPLNNWIELQIRSERMDYEAEEGKAAHWKYKKETPTS